MVNLSINALHEGNMLRFINDYKEDYNVKVLYVPLNNIWKIYYVALTTILPGEELSISYG